MIEVIAGDFAQQLLGRCQRALGRDDGRRAAVVCGAGFLDVGDGDQADLKARLGLVELPLDRDECDLLGFEVVLGGEHVEVTLRDALDQVLLRRLIVGLGLRHLRIGALQCHPIFPAENVLLEVEAVAMRGGIGSSIERETLEDRGRTGSAGADRFRRVLRAGVALMAHDAATGELRQQRGQSLRFGFERRQPIRFRFAQGGIVLQRALIDREEIGGRRLRRPAAQYNESQQSLHGLP